MASIFKFSIFSRKANNSSSSGSSRGVFKRKNALESQKNVSEAKRRKNSADKVAAQKHQDPFDSIVDNINANIDNSRFGSKTNVTRTQLQELAKENYLFFPQNYWKKVWDTIIFILVMILCLVEPFDLSLQDSDSAPKITLASRVAEIFFVIDIMVTFNTMFITRGGEPVCNRFQIAFVYLKFWFWFDFVAMLPSIIFRVVPITNFNRLSFEYILLSLLRLVRITRVPRIIKRFSRIIELNPKSISFITRICVIVIAFHWTACVYWLGATFIASYNAYYALDDKELGFYNLLGSNESLYNYVQTWLPPRELLFFNTTKMTYNVHVNQYLWSLFFSVMVTTGSGRDIRPTTESEYLVSIICVLIGLMIFAYIVSGVTALINAQEGEEASLRQALFGLESFFKKHPSVPQTQRVRAKDWILYRFSRTGVGSQRYNELLSDLPESLALEIKVFLRKPIVDKLELFTQINNSLCVMDLIDRLEMRLMLPGETVYEKGDHPDGFYIVVQGTLKEKKGDGMCLMKSHKAITMFGEKELVLQLARLSSFIAATHVELLKLCKKDYSILFTKYPDFANALTKIVCGKEVGGWGKVRQMIKITRTARYIGSESDMKEKLLNLNTSYSSNSLLNESQLYESDGKAYQYFVYKKQKQQEIVNIRDSMEKSSDSSHTLHRRTSVFEMERRRQTLAGNLLSRTKSLD